MTTPKPKELSLDDLHRLQTGEIVELPDVGKARFVRLSAGRAVFITIEDERRINVYLPKGAHKIPPGVLPGAQTSTSPASAGTATEARTDKEPTDVPKPSAGGT